RPTSEGKTRAAATWEAARVVSSRSLDGRDAELALLERRHRLGRELVVHEHRLAGGLRLTLGSLHLIADQVRVGGLHALAVLVHRVAEMLHLPHVEPLLR